MIWHFLVGTLLLMPVIALDAGAGTASRPQVTVFSKEAFVKPSKEELKKKLTALQKRPSPAACLPCRRQHPGQ